MLCVPRYGGLYVVPRYEGFTSCLAMRALCRASEEGFRRASEEGFRRASKEGFRRALQ